MRPEELPRHDPQVDRRGDEARSIDRRARDDTQVIRQPVIRDRDGKRRRIRCVVPLLDERRPRLSAREVEQPDMVRQDGRQADEDEV